MVKTGRWVPLVAFASEYLPLPQGQLRAGEPLGSDRQETVFRHLHESPPRGAGRVKVRGVDPETGKPVFIAATDWSHAIFPMNQMIKTGGRWVAFGNVEVHFVNASQPRSRGRPSPYGPQAEAAVRAMMNEGWFLAKPKPRAGATRGEIRRRVLGSKFAAAPGLGDDMLNKRIRKVCTGSPPKKG
jgi:hypothetical protein